MSGPVTIRPVEQADLPGFHAVMMAAGMDPRSSWNRTTLTDLERSLFGADSGGFIAELENAGVVGCVGYRPDGTQTLTLNKLATRPEVRGQGLGARLVQAVESHASRAGYARVLLAVSQFNQDVIPFYIRLGYARSEEPYAHANPASPAPVVFVKNLGTPARAS
ncbi:GNAT family N-acetyltransferase [Deinococcus deserti]|uniref:Putative GCN5-related N-acetyltransferase n=1 Tax=Deinococcus deserti (strain DSM 17065 / CIP 109153 / LMG 22923 / VCD115) TaxID=546414 RepID=C1CXR9_DEIDV|nr:GNAT family N-acetyltransferase [Deinococcus deserti]ACO44875.1 putative GCN5-related N-acetyltransferase [Deinococcus deserti VCD115]